METESKKCDCCRSEYEKAAGEAFVKLQEVVSQVAKKGAAWIQIWKGIAYPQRGLHRDSYIPFDEGLYWEARAALECAKESSEQSSETSISGESGSDVAEKSDRAPADKGRDSGDDVAEKEANQVSTKQSESPSQKGMPDFGIRVQEAGAAWEVAYKARGRAVAVRTQREITIQVYCDQIESRKVAISEARDEIEAAEAAAEKAKVVWREAEIGGVTKGSDEERGMEQRVRDADKALSKAHEAVHATEKIVEMARQAVEKAEVAYQAAKDVERVYRQWGCSVARIERAAEAANAAYIANAGVLVALDAVAGKADKRA